MKKFFYILPLLILLSFGVWYFFFSPFVKGGSSNPEAEAAAPREGLTLYYTTDISDTYSANGTATTTYDKSGNNRTGIVYRAYNEPGKLKESMYFEGTTNSYINAGTFNIASGGKFTLAAWWKPKTSSGYAGNNYIFAKGSDATANSYGIDIYCPTGVITSCKFACITFVGSLQYTISAAGDRRGWHHYACSYDGTTMRSYIDGVPDDDNVIAAPAASSNAIYIGKQARGAPYDYVSNGWIDEVRGYNRALSAQEVANLYNATKTSFTASQASNASSTSGKAMVGYWTMDNTDTTSTTVWDRSGYKNHGTLNGPTAGKRGKIGQAVDFSGGYTVNISVPYKASLKSTRFTVAAWVYPHRTTGGDNVVAMNGNTYDANFILYPGVVGFDGNLGWTQTTAVTVIPNKWRYIVGTFDGATLKFYENGVLMNSLDTANVPDRDGYGMKIGTYYGGDNGFDGLIDEFRVYNYALSPQEVMDLYQGSKRNFVVTPTRDGLVGYWRMDNTDRNSNLIFDKSGYNNHGTLIGSTTSTGVIKEARDFNGTSDYAKLGDILDDVFAGADKKFSISTWVKPGAVMTNNPIVAKNGDANCGENQREFFLRLYTGSKPEFTYYSALASTPSLRAKGVLGSTAITNMNKWYHIVVTYDGSLDTNDGLDRVEIYVDGFKESKTLDINLGTIGDIQDGTAEFGIGSSVGASGSICSENPFNGTVDEVRIYRHILSAQEVANLYSSARGNYK